MRRFAPACLSVSIAIALTACGGGGGGGNVRSDPPPPVPPLTDTTSQYIPLLTQFRTQTHADTANTSGLTGRGVIVGVIDSGVNLRYPALVSKPITWLPYGNSTVEQDPPEGLTPGQASHGTAVASIIAGNAVDRFPGGIAPDATLLMGRNLSYPTPVRMVQMGARIINFSAGDTYALETSTLDDYNRLFSSMPDIFRQVRDGGALLVLSAANQGNAGVNYLAGTPHYFPDITNLIAAVATDPTTGQIAGYSNRCGEWAKNWCLAAPGSVLLPATDATAVPTTFDVPSTYRVFSGTSAAAPVISGVAALTAQAFPWMNGTQLAQTLFTTATDIGAPGVDNIYGWGLVNAERAVKGPAAVSAAFYATVPAGTTSVFGNDIGGTGGIVKTNGGTLVLDGHNTYTGTTVLNEGALIINGQTAGLLQFGGALGGTGTIQGDLTQNAGRLLVGTSPLRVAGTANLSDTLHLSPSSVLIGQQWSGTVLTAQSITGGGHTADELLFFDTQLTVQPQSIQATLTRRSAAEQLAAQGDATTLQSARRLDQWFDQANQPDAAPDALGSLLALQSLTTPQALPVVDSLSGQAHATARGLLVEAAETQRHWLAERALNAQQDAGGWWFSAGTHSGTVRPASAFDVEITHQQQAVGIDRAFGAKEQWRLGVSGQSSDLRADFDRFGGRVRAEQLGLAVYAGWTQGAWSARGTLAASQIDQDIQRLVSDGATSSWVRTQPRARLVSLEAAVQRQWTPQVAGFIQASVDQLGTDAFREAGGTGLELAAQADTFHRTALAVGVSIRDRRTHQDGWHWSTTWAHQYLITPPDTGFQASFGAAPDYTFRVEGMDTPRNSLWGSGALEYRSGIHSLFLRGDARWDSVSRQDSWSLSYRQRF